MNKKTILITGGLGYIGSHAVVAFEQAGYKTVIIDNLSNTDRRQLDGIEKIIGHVPVFYEGDILDGDLLQRIFSEENIDGVIHFAGLKAVGESCKQPHKYYRNNVQGSISLFEEMQNAGITKLIFSSSATVYHASVFGKGKGAKEDDLAGQTTNPYGTTKFVLEQMTRDLALHQSWSVVNLRYFNPVGADPSGYIGENPRGIPNNLLPYILQVASGDREKLGVFGDDYDTADGTGVRDYIDVVDLIEGHLRAYESLTEGLSTYNLGTGTGVSVMEMLTCAEKVVGKNIPHIKLPRRPGDLACVYADSTLAKKELNREAKTPIQESIENSRRFIEQTMS